MRPENYQYNPSEAELITSLKVWWATYEKEHTMWEYERSMRPNPVREKAITMINYYSQLLTKKRQGGVLSN